MSGLLINERGDSFARIALWYDPDDENKVELEVDLFPNDPDKTEVTHVFVPKDKAMDAFAHPFCYVPSEYEQREFDALLEAAL